MRIRHWNHFSHTSHRSLPTRLVAFLLAAVTVLTSVLFGAPAQAADNRSWLRPGCVWDRHGNYIQYCNVWSPSSNRMMGVLIQPAKFGGTGGLYLLSGLGAPEGDSQWSGTSAVRTFINDNVNVIMPAGGEGQFYADWQMAGQPLLNNNLQVLPPKQWPHWETFLTSELPAYLQANFGVDPHRNSIVGISMGAIPTLTLAARHNNQFRQAIAMSGFIDPAMFTHLGMITGIQIATSLFGGGQVWEMWGLAPWDFFRNLVHADPVAQAAGLRNVDTIVWAGNGELPAGDVYPDEIHKWGAIYGEKAINMMSASFVNKARAQGVNVEFQTGPGIHIWPSWERQLAFNRARILRVVG